MTIHNLKIRLFIISNEGIYKMKYKFKSYNNLIHHRNSKLMEKLKGNKHN